MGRRRWTPIGRWCQWTSIGRRLLPRPYRRPRRPRELPPLLLWCRLWIPPPPLRHPLVRPQLLPVRRPPLRFRPPSLCLPRHLCRPRLLRPLRRPRLLCRPPTRPIGPLARACASHHPCRVALDPIHPTPRSGQPAYNPRLGWRCQLSLACTT